MYHVVQTHPQLVIPTRFGIREGTPFDPQAFIDADIQYLRAMSDGMDGMCHADDVRVAESLRDLELPADASLGDGHVEPHAQRRGRALAPRAGPRHARPQRARRAGDQPHVLPRLPALLRAADVQRRLRVPVPSVGTGGDADGDLVAGALRRAARSSPRPTPPEVWECDDPRWPAIPAQDFSNLPRQQRGLHARGFEYMRLSSGLEGHISNFQRTIDGYLAGRPARAAAARGRRRSTCTRSSSRSATSGSERRRHRQRRASSRPSPSTACRSGRCTCRTRGRRTSRPSASAPSHPRTARRRRGAPPPWSAARRSRTCRAPVPVN